MEKAPRPGGAAEVPVAPVARCLGLLGPVKFGDSSRCFFLATTCGMRHLSFPARDPGRAPCVGSAES